VWIVVGLGNPGSEYRGTRHNVGFRVVEELRRRHGAPAERREARCRVARARVGDSDVAVARPQTFMNLSGAAVGPLLTRHEASPADLLVVCDDLYLEVGTIRLRPRGSHGGHNGLRSIIGTLGTADFPRIRVGVGPAEAGVEHSDFVLGEFRREDRDRIESTIALAAECAETVVTEGMERAMNRFNRRPDAGAADAGAGR
jgi:PTH1 family peptidyl-tRNA hydrolase